MGFVGFMREVEIVLRKHYLFVALKQSRDDTSRLNHLVV